MSPVPGASMDPLDRLATGFRQYNLTPVYAESLNIASPGCGAGVFGGRDGTGEPVINYPLDPFATPEASRALLAAGATEIATTLDTPQPGPASLVPPHHHQRFELRSARWGSSRDTASLDQRARYNTTRFTHSH
ncbi:hypothetical protein PGTUg99_027707 [Puccinia graminis f. sp. tritici]|uniref:Uncharacterized protein n=1 Tax=Puccinia graminis f. sp. tritici TaxID=56615 RepID=A0A5B0QM11_PUCGR|nr:hypothetical protein PGTUg99_027707 [Puccinia graminis f. sp. tritici]